MPASMELRVDAQRLFRQDPGTFREAVKSIRANSRMEIIAKAADEILRIAEGGADGN